MRHVCNIFQGKSRGKRSRKKRDECFYTYEALQDGRNFTGILQSDMDGDAGGCRASQASSAEGVKMLQHPASGRAGLGWPAAVPPVLQAGSASRRADWRPWHGRASSRCLCSVLDTARRHFLPVCSACWNGSGVPPREGSQNRDPKGASGKAVGKAGLGAWLGG